MRRRSWSRAAREPQHVERVPFDFGFTRDEIARARLATNPARGSNGTDSRFSDRADPRTLRVCARQRALRLLDEKVAARPVEIDVICVLGNTFPAYRGGPLFYADEVGPASVLELVNEYRVGVGGDGWEPSATPPAAGGERRTLLRPPSIGPTGSCEVPDADSSYQLKRLLAPRSIAVVGASASADKAGHQALVALARFDVGGLPINPRASEVLGARRSPRCPRSDAR